MQCVAGPEIKQLGLVFTALPPGPVSVKSTVAGSWAVTSGFAGGEEVLEFNGLPPVDMTEDKFKEVIKSRPLTIKFRQGELPPQPSPRPGPPLRELSDKLEDEVISLMSMPGSYKYVGGIIAMVRSSLKAAGMKQYGMKWTKIFQDQDTDRSGRITWIQFHSLCRESLALKEPDVQLRMVYRCLGDNDRTKGVLLDELVAFLSDPLERMRKRFKLAISRLTPERWFEILEEHPTTWDFNPFVEMCRDNLGIRDAEVHIWLVFRAVAGNDSSPITPDQVRIFLADEGKPPSRPSITVQKQQTKAQRRQNSRNIRQQVMTKANSERDTDDGVSRASSVASRQHSIKSTGSDEKTEITMSQAAEGIGLTRRDVSNMLSKMTLQEVEFPDGLEPTTIGTLDQTIMKVGGRGVAWLGLTGDDWVVVSTRERGEPDYCEAHDLAPVKAGTRLVFIHRPSAVARGYSTFAGDQTRSRDVLSRLSPNEKLMERVTLCRTNHVFKSRGGQGRVSIAYDNSYVVLPGATLLEREGDIICFGYQPMDRITSNCGKVTESRETPELDFFTFTPELVGEKGSRLGPKKGKENGIDLHGEHGLNVIGLARKSSGTEWDLQWCPTVDFFARSGDVCIATRRRDFEQPAIPGLVHVAAVAGANAI